jgi:hypothetical protein
MEFYDIVFANQTNLMSPVKVGSIGGGTWIIASIHFLFG